MRTRYSAFIVIRIGLSNMNCVYVNRKKPAFASLVLSTVYGIERGTVYRSAILAGITIDLLHIEQHLPLFTGAALFENVG